MASLAGLTLSGCGGGNSTPDAPQPTVDAALVGTWDGVLFSISDPDPRSSAITGTLNIQADGAVQMNATIDGTATNKTGTIVAQNSVITIQYTDLTTFTASYYILSGTLHLSYNKGIYVAQQTWDNRHDPALVGIWDGVTFSTSDPDPRSSAITGTLTVSADGSVHMNATIDGTTINKTGTIVAQYGAITIHYSDTTVFTATYTIVAGTLTLSYVKDTYAAQQTWNNRHDPI
jgi:hypothetical protein